jgi:hypothetical protein
VTSMEVTSAVAALRALLTEDLDTYRRLHAGLDAGQRLAFAVVLTVAFDEAAVRRFGGDHTLADIIEFVADARARYPRTGEAVPTEGAALGEDDLIDRLDGHAYGAAQTAMLFALTRGDHDVEALLASAAAQGEDYLKRRAGR